MEFEPFPKIPRLRRDIVVTEKIDGTNAQIAIDEDGNIQSGSRKRWVTPLDDNFGFGRWVHDNSGVLVAHLGPGRHFGEWWGQGIQRGYGLTEKRFSLFNVNRWQGRVDLELQAIGVNHVPVLERCNWDDANIDLLVETLALMGSSAAPGFMDPEGVVLFHSASGSLFKRLIKNDDIPKGQAA